MHGATTKIIEAQQTKLCNISKNAKLKLVKSNAAIWFNKMCRIKQLKLNYINNRIKGEKLPQDGKTTSCRLKS